MKLRDRIIESITDIITRSLSLTGAILFTSGITLSVTGLTGKAIEKVSQAIKPYSSSLQSQIIYGTSSAFLGLLIGGTGLLIAKATDKYLDDLVWEEEFYKNQLREEDEIQTSETSHNNNSLNNPEHIGNVLGEFRAIGDRELTDFEVRARLVFNKKTKKPEQCNGCLFYCENDYMKCAVNPELSEGCPHFIKELKPL